MAKGKYWTEDEEQELVAAFIIGGLKGAEGHAEKRNRPIRGVIARLKSLGYSCTSEEGKSRARTDARTDTAEKQQSP